MVLHLRVEAPDAWKDAKCAIVEVTREHDDFFDDPEAAVEFCNGDADGVVCPLRESCLLFAAVNNCAWGVYGGMREEDRRIMRKLWPLKSGKTPRPEWRWFTHEELTSLLAAKIESGEISTEQVEEAKEWRFEDEEE
jgi:hypothetical protein